MTKQEIISKIEDIKLIAKDTNGDSDMDTDNIKAIIKMCDAILYDYKISQRLGEENE